MVQRKRTSLIQQIAIIEEDTTESMENYQVKDSADICIPHGEMQTYQQAIAASLKELLYGPLCIHRHTHTYTDFVNGMTFCEYPRG